MLEGSHPEDAKRFKQMAQAAVEERFQYLDFLASRSIGSGEDKKA
jgi:hypothetical protein